MSKYSGYREYSTPKRSGPKAAQSLLSTPLKPECLAFIDERAAEVGASRAGYARRLLEILVDALQTGDIAPIERLVDRSGAKRGAPVASAQLSG